MIRTFTIAVDDEILDDLRERLRRTRFPGASDPEPWAAGTDPAYLRELVEYWHSEFDWRRIERQLNTLPQVLVDVEGTTLHAVHLRAQGAASALPLILSHGWPSAFVEMLRVAGPLADPGAYGGDPADAFDVVIPSLPGVAFSELPRGAPMTRAHVARLWTGLMTELGYDRFGAFGGDIGGDVTNWLAIDHPGRLVGLHLIHPGVPTEAASDPSLTDDERHYFEALARFDAGDEGYSAMQATRPDTVAAALIDSPSGLASWMVDKFRAWSDCGGDLESVISRDTFLSIATLYWVTGCIGTSFRTYYDYRYNAPKTRIQVPAAMTPSVEEDLPRSLPERLYADIRQWRQHPRGGHFMAMEQPDLVVQDLRDFFRPLRAHR